MCLVYGGYRKVRRNSPSISTGSWLSRDVTLHLAWLPVLAFVVIVLTGLCYIAQAGLELSIFLPLLSESGITGRATMPD
jgi:hypothetical protein